MFESQLSRARVHNDVDSVVHRAGAGSGELTALAGIKKQSAKSKMVVVEPFFFFCLQACPPVI